METRIAVNIGYKDRPTELALLLESLMHQEYSNFDIFILNDCSGTPIEHYYFLGMLITKLRLNGHMIKIINSEFPHGVSRARQRLVDETLKYNYTHILRVDDDVILAKDYISRMLAVLREGYDIASGVTPPLQPTQKRNSNFLDIADEVIMKEGKVIYDGDDCGMEYTHEKIVPCHHFRSCALIKREVHEKVNYYPTRLTKHGFREETLFSFKSLMRGFKIGVDLKANAWHLNTPSGGERFSDSRELIIQNMKVLDEFIEENKEELSKLFPYREISNLKLKRETNLRR